MRNQPRFCSHIFHATRLVSYHLERDFLSLVVYVTSVSYLLIFRFLINIFFADGWFCAGPSPVYQHHHHPTPYPHIPSSPYDRLGVRSHRPSPYPNPYRKRTDLPTQGNDLSFSLTLKISSLTMFCRKNAENGRRRFENY